MHDLGLKESPALCDYFDMIGGVGTGGYVWIFWSQDGLDGVYRYIVILVGRLGLSVPQVKEEFKQLIAWVLVGSISSEELNQFLRAMVKRYTGDPETPMYDPNSPTSHCKT
jgi:hypothetical protein